MSVFTPKRIREVPADFLAALKGNDPRLYGGPAPLLSAHARLGCFSTEVYS